MNGGDGIPLTQAGGSVLKEIMGTPFIKELLWNSLVDTDPANGPKLVRDLLWEDVGVALSVVDGLPAVLNYLIGAFSELIIQVEDKFSPAMLLSIVQAIEEDLDTEPLKKAGSSMARLAQGLIGDTGTDIPASIGKAITAAARELNTLHAQDPTRIPAYAQAMMANIDAREVSRMTTTVLNAVLDQRPPLVSWAAHMLAGRVRERFSKWRRGRQ